jgi:hypothetical protein
MNGTGVGDGQREHYVNSGQLDHRAEGFIVVDARLLGEVVNDSVSLVLFQNVVRVKLVLENPFTGEDVRANGARDKIPSVVGYQGSKFFFYCMMPIRISEGGADGGGHR